jgi:adhesin transport system outer membrane protein
MRKTAHTRRKRRGWRVDAIAMAALLAIGSVASPARGQSDSAVPPKAEAGARGALMATLLEKLPALQSLLSKLQGDNGATAPMSPMSQAQAASPKPEADEVPATFAHSWREVTGRLKEWFDQLALSPAQKTAKADADARPEPVPVPAATIAASASQAAAAPTERAQALEAVELSASAPQAPSTTDQGMPAIAMADAAMAGRPPAAAASSAEVRAGDDPPPDSPAEGYRNMARLLGLKSVLPLPDRPAGQQLTLRDAQRLARTHSTEVEAAMQRLAGFGFARDAAQGALLPQADATVGVGIGENTAVSPHLRLARRESTLTVRQALYDESLRRGFGQKRQLIVSAEQQLESALSQSLLESGGAYMDALRLRVNIELSQTHERRLDELLRYISARAAAGGASAAERERVKSRVANLRASVADNRSSLAAALRNLYRVTGLEPGALTLDEPLPGVSVDVAAQAVALAMRSNPELQAARAEADAAEQEIGVQRARHLPRVDMALTRNQSVNAAGTEGHIQDTKVMLNISVPLFHGGSDEAQVNAAVARRLELAARARGVERRLTMEIDTAYANLSAFVARFDAVREEMESNRKVVDAFQAQLVGGNRPLLDVLDAYQRFYQSQLDLAQLLVNEAQTRLRLSHLTGGLLQATAASPATPGARARD